MRRSILALSATALLFGTSVQAGERVRMELDVENRKGVSEIVEALGRVPPEAAYLINQSGSRLIITDRDIADFRFRMPPDLSVFSDFNEPYMGPDKLGMSQCYLKGKLQHSYSVVKKGKKDSQRAALHESGHMLDCVLGSFNPVRKVTTLDNDRLIKEYTSKEPLVSGEMEFYDVVKESLRRGRKVTFEGHMPTDYPEIFAGSYERYRLLGERFHKSHPELYAYFSKLDERIRNGEFSIPGMPYVKTENLTK